MPVRPAARSLAVCFVPMRPRLPRGVEMEFRHGGRLLYSFEVGDRRRW